MVRLSKPVSDYTDPTWLAPAAPALVYSTRTRWARLSKTVSVEAVAVSGVRMAICHLAVKSGIKRCPLVGSRYCSVGIPVLADKVGISFALRLRCLAVAADVTLLIAVKLVSASFAILSYSGYRCSNSRQ